jgi:glycosyltransferase-like protein
VTPHVALVTYSVKPRGGVVHLLHLAEALHARGVGVEVVALGDPAVGFFRPVGVPHTFVSPPLPAPTLEQRVFDAIDALTAGLRARSDPLPAILHVQDCIAARATTRIRDDGQAVRVLRTVHHVDDFTTPALVDCQRRSILEPDRVLAVSRRWQQELAEQYRIEADVVTNGVDAARFATADPAVVAACRARVGADDRPFILTVGGIEPRKGTDSLFAALARLRERLDPAPVLGVVGGHSFQDHREYRERVLGSMPGLGIELDRDVVLLGTVPDDELPAWYHAADAFAFPSVKEGWGLVVLEAMAAGTPVVVSDLPVFREYVSVGTDALATPPGDAEELAAQLARLILDRGLAARLGATGRELASRFTWERTAAQHEAIYEEMLDRPG